MRIAGILATAAGRWFVGLTGVIVFAVGIGMIIYGVRRTFVKRLNRMPRRTRETVVALGVIGYLAKGIALGMGEPTTVAASIY